MAPMSFVQFFHLNHVLNDHMSVLLLQLSTVPCSHHFALISVQNDDLLAGNKQIS